jgi:PAS domain S-box-containing protein
MTAPYRLLHLEDNALDAELVQTRLRLDGLPADIYVVYTQADFMTALRSATFDAVLADYVLPAFDGMRALTLVREQYPELPFIFVTGELGEERAIETLRHGATDYVLKSRLSRLRPAVQRALAENTERQARQRAEAAAAAEREWLRVTLGSIGDAVIASDTAGTITFINPVAEQVTGWTQAEAIGQPVSRVFHIVNEITRARVESPVDKVLREGVIAGLANHTILIRQDGGEVLIDDSGAPIRASNGELLGAVLVFRDITPRREAEAALRSSEARYRSVIEAATAVVWVSDPGGQIVARQEAWEAHTGLAWPAYAGDGWLERLHPEDREVVLARWQQAVATHTGFATRVRLWQAAAQGYRYAAMRVVPVLDPAGHVREWASTATDIHDRVVAQEAARLSAERTARLQTITAALSGALTPDDVFDVVLSRGIAMLEGAAGAVVLAGADGALQVARNPAASLQPIIHSTNLTDDAPAAETIRLGEPLWLRSQTDFAVRFPHLARVRAASGFEAAAYLPLAISGQVIGCLVTAFSRVREFAPEDQVFLLALANQCALALERARLYAQTQAQNAELEGRVRERTEELEAANLALRVANTGLEEQMIERRQAEERIRLSEKRLQEAQHLASIGSWHWELATNRLTWSDELYRIYGLDPAEFQLSYENFVERVHPDDRERVQASIVQAGADRQPFTFDHRIVRPDGSVRTLNARGEVLLDPDGQVVAMTGTGQDVSERKAIEEELRRLSAHLHAAREEERKRIAREIHDELGGNMTGLKMAITRLSNAASRLTPEEVMAQAAAIAADIDDTVRAIRRIATELRPAILDDFGLPAAIEWQLKEFQARAHLACQLDNLLEDDLQLSSEQATAVFRVFQETLTNVARHAQATRVAVSLEVDEDWLVLHVQDDGRGMSPAQTTDRRSLGLLGMRERINLIGGELDLQSQPGQGTEITVRVPLTITPDV